MPIIQCETTSLKGRATFPNITHIICRSTEFEHGIPSHKLFIRCQGNVSFE